MLRRHAVSDQEQKITPEALSALARKVQSYRDRYDDERRGWHDASSRWRQFEVGLKNAESELRKAFEAYLGSTP